MAKAATMEWCIIPTKKFPLSLLLSQDSSLCDLVTHSLINKDKDKDQDKDKDIERAVSKNNPRDFQTLITFLTLENNNLNIAILQ